MAFLARFPQVQPHMKKILISDKLAEAGINYLNQQAESGIHIHIQTGLDEAGLCEIIGEYDALLIRSDTKVTKKVLEAAKDGAVRWGAKRHVQWIVHAAEAEAL